MSLLQAFGQTVEEIVLDNDSVILPEDNTVVVYTEEPTPELVMEMHEPNLEPVVMEVEPSEVEIVVQDLPGVANLDPELEEKLEVSEEDLDKEDENNAEKVVVKPGKWNWEQKGAAGFVDWVKERLDNVPQHSGYDTAGIERAISYMDKLDNEISKAMRNDLDGELNADKIEQIRAQIHDGIDRLSDRLQKVNKKSKKRKKKAGLESDLVKEAQKIPGVSGIIITVPLLISLVARVCINGTVSAGHDMVDIFKRQCDKYKLTEREKAEAIQLMSDMGYPVLADRGFLPDEEIDLTSSDNFDWSSSRQA